MADKTTPRGQRDAIRLTPEILTAWRTRLGLSQVSASEALGCSRAAWRGWESGKSPVPKYIGLAMAALALGISPYSERKKR